jgi:hypothetical protein
MSSIEELIAERDAYLEKNPDLKKYQDKIDGLLETSLDSTVRLDIICMLMVDKLREMNEVWGTVKSV